MKRYVAAFILLLTSLLAGCGPVSGSILGTPEPSTPTMESATDPTPTPAATPDIAYLTLRAEVIDPVHYGVQFTATVVGGPDNNRGLGCPGQDWRFGDGQMWSQIPGCVDIPKAIERIYKKTYYYRDAGTYTAVFKLSHLQASATMSFLPPATPTPTSTPDPNVPRLEVKADPVFSGGFAITFTVEVVGGPDRNPDLACASVFWDFGDGRAYITERRCEPGAMDAPIRRVFRQTHTYQREGGYDVTVQIGNLRKRLIAYTPLTTEPFAPTPTPHVSASLSRPTPDSVRAAYEAWPADYKYAISDDIVVRFPYPCDVCMWAGMAFIEHLPSASGATIRGLYQSGRQDEMGKEDLAVKVGEHRIIVSRYYQSSTGEDALDRVLMDRELMLPIVQRALGFNG